MSIVSTVGALRALASQRPSLPPRSVVDRSLVERRRPLEVPVTWIDAASARTGAVVHLRDGGFLHGESTREWAWLEELRRRSGTAAAMIHYRMPPRFPFPAASEDAGRAVRGMLEAMDVWPGAWVLSGAGAGAGLAIAVARTLRDAGVDQPALLLLTSPWVDLAEAREQAPEAVRAARLYARDLPVTDPRISPLLGELDGLPPVHVTIGARDPLAQQGRRLAERITELGGEVRLEVAPALGHDVARAEGALGQSALRPQIAAIREALRLRR